MNLIKKIFRAASHSKEKKENLNQPLLMPVQDALEIVDWFLIQLEQRHLEPVPCPDFPRSKGVPIYVFKKLRNDEYSKPDIELAFKTVIASSRDAEYVSLCIHVLKTQVAEIVPNPEVLKLEFAEQREVMEKERSRVWGDVDIYEKVWDKLYRQ